MKFMINQLKGNMQESEMRASAAEYRVAMLQQKIKDMDSQDGDGNGNANQEENAKIEKQNQ